MTKENALSEIDLDVHYYGGKARGRVGDILDEYYNQAIDDAIEVVKVQYGRSGVGVQSPISSPLHGTSRGSLTQNIISKLEALKK